MLCLVLLVFFAVAHSRLPDGHSVAPFQFTFDLFAWLAVILAGAALVVAIRAHTKAIEAAAEERRISWQLDAVRELIRIVHEPTDESNPSRVARMRATRALLPDELIPNIAALLDGLAGPGTHDVPTTAAIDGAIGEVSQDQGGDYMSELLDAIDSLLAQRPKEW